MCLNSFADEAVIVSQQHARAAHDALPCKGTQAEIVVPWPGMPTMSTLPPRSETLCRMLAWPRLILERFLGRIKAITIVPDRKLQTAVERSQLHLGLAGPGMTCNVAQPFLHDPKQTKCHVARQVLGHCSGLPSSRIKQVVEWRSHSALSASSKPRSLMIEGCSRYESACTSSLNRTKCSRIVRIALPAREFSDLRSSRPASIASDASRCVTSSCSSRARRERLSSWAGG